MAFEDLFKDPTREDVERMKVALRTLDDVGMRVNGFPGAGGYHRSLASMREAVYRVQRYVDRLEGVGKKRTGA